MPFDKHQRLIFIFTFNNPVTPRFELKLTNPTLYIFWQILPKVCHPKQVTLSIWLWSKLRGFNWIQIITTWSKKIYKMNLRANLYNWSMYNIDECKIFWIFPSIHKIFRRIKYIEGKTFLMRKREWGTINLFQV